MGKEERRRKEGKERGGGIGSDSEVKRDRGGEKCGGRDGGEEAECADRVTHRG